MAHGRLLIVAPDPDLRRSLEFALEAEGYAVASCATIDAADMAEAYDCTILDHRAAAAPTDAVLSFCRRADPVVLLAGNPTPWLAARVFRVVQKPLLGEPLSNAIRDAIVSRASA